MQVRPATLADADELARQYARVAEEGWIASEPPIDLEARAERFRGFIEADDPETTFMLELDGKPVGHGGIHKTHAPGVVTFGMAVMPEARGAGGGRALLNRIVDHAREHGCHKIELEVWIDNGAAISLYATSGFDVEGPRRDHYRRKDGSLRSALVMARQLGR
jgi:putative acetyltransferase